MKDDLMKLTTESTMEQVIAFTESYVPEDITPPDPLMLLVTYAAMQENEKKLFEFVMDIANLLYSPATEDSFIDAGVDPNKGFRVTYDQFVEGARQLIISIVNGSDNDKETSNV